MFIEIKVGDIIEFRLYHFRNDKSDWHGAGIVVEKTNMACNVMLLYASDKIVGQYDRHVGDKMAIYDEEVVTLNGVAIRQPPQEL